MERLARWYRRRIVNVNVNIIAAGVLALIITAIVMHFFDEVWDWDQSLAAVLPVNAKVIITAATFLVDLVADLAVYYALHWYANHVPSRFEKMAHVGGVPELVEPDLAKPAFTKESLAASPLSPQRVLARARGQGVTRSFVRDATKVQVERMILSPILYVVALGLQHALLHGGMGTAWATAIGFGAGILVTRTLHTIFMLREEWASARKLAAAGTQASAAQASGTQAGREAPDGRGEGGGGAKV